MDADGHCSAAIVYNFLVNDAEQKVSPDDIDFVPMNYGMDLPEYKFNYGEDHFYMVDFSFQPRERMEEFYEKTAGKFVWIDHHETILEYDDGALGDCKGIRETGRAGCVLTWDYFYDAPMPGVVEVVGTYDIWDKEDQERWDSVILPFQFFLRSLDTRPKKSEALNQGVNWWCHMLTLEEVPDYLIEQGTKYMNYSQREEDRSVRGRGFKGKLAGHTAYFVNKPGNSQMFERVYDTNEVELLVTFINIRGKYWSVSIYGANTAVHCGELAKRLGHAGPRPSGGGHQKAAGFQTDWAYFRSLIEVEE
jgi:oligoribonuclease NrnB/cAMP/cGMP phosphodiesterase (DHH superfamily)